MLLSICQCTWQTVGSKGRHATNMTKYWLNKIPVGMWERGKELLRHNVNETWPWNFRATIHFCTSQHLSWVMTHFEILLSCSWIKATHFLNCRIWRIMISAFYASSMIHPEENLKANVNSPQSQHNKNEYWLLKNLWTTGSHETVGWNVPMLWKSIEENVLPSHTISGRELHPSLLLPTTAF